MQPEQRIGPYILIRELGRGAFGTVWLAEKHTAITTTRVALKIPREAEVDLSVVQQEATLWVQASGHANVLPIIEADVYDGRVVIVSEYAPDGSLAGWLRQHGGIAPDLEAATDMAVGLLAGLQHLHDRHIIHRDLKPENILLQGNTPRLADFGIARLLKSTSESTQISGTLAYMAPEAFDGKRSVQTDVWSAGVICYQMLTGALPYPQTELAALVGAIMRFDPPPLPLTVTPALRDVVMLALRRDPAERFRSASAMRLALRAAARADSSPWRPETVPVRPQTDPTRPLPPEVVPETIPVVPQVETERLPPPIIHRSEPVKPPRDKVAWAFGIGGAGAVLALFVALALLFGMVYYFWPKKTTDGLGGNGPIAGRKPPAVTSGTWTLSRTLTSDKGGPGSIAFTPDGEIMACVWNYVGSPTVKLFRTATGELITTLPAQADWVGSLDISPDGKWLTGTMDKSIRIWNIPAGTIAQTLAADDKVNGTLFSPDGKYLATVGEDKKIILWDTKTWRRSRTLADNVYAENLAFSPDGKMLASNPGLKIWDVETGALKATLHARDDDNSDSVAFSSDGKYVATGNLYSNTADLWNVQTGKLAHTFTEFTGWVDSVDFTPEGTLLAMRSRDGTLKIADVNTYQIVQSLPGSHPNESSGDDLMRISPDGAWLACGDGNVSILLFKRGP